MNNKARRSPEYLTGYASGYAAGLRHGLARATTRHRYTRRYWRCGSCAAVGVVLFRDDDDPRRKAWRLQQSHQAQRGRGCREPRLYLLTSAEVKRIAAARSVNGVSKRT